MNIHILIKCSHPNINFFAMFIGLPMGFNIRLIKHYEILNFQKRICTELCHCTIVIICINVYSKKKRTLPSILSNIFNTVLFSVLLFVFNVSSEPLESIFSLSDADILECLLNRSHPVFCLTEIQIKKDMSIF